MHQGTSQTGRLSGFTLIELMVVLVIIAVLTGLVAQNFIGRDQQAMRQAVTTDFNTIDNALQMYRLDNGRYPSEEQGLDALLSEPSGTPEPRNWSGPYLRSEPEDPWGMAYQYSLGDNGNPVLTSYGADGQAGGEGDDADITNRDVGQ